MMLGCWEGEGVGGICRGTTRTWWEDPESDLSVLCQPRQRARGQELGLSNSRRISALQRRNGIWRAGLWEYTCQGGCSPDCKQSMHAFQGSQLFILASFLCCRLLCYLSFLIKALDIVTSFTKIHAGRQNEGWLTSRTVFRAVRYRQKEKGAAEDEMAR